MYLNRFTISIISESTIPIEEIRPFNIVYSEIEDTLFKNMPKKIKVGGYGYVSIKLNNHEVEKDSIKTYGKCVDCYLQSYPFSLDSFLKKNLIDQQNEILMIYKKAVQVLATNLEVSETELYSAINSLMR